MVKEAEQIFKSEWSLYEGDKKLEPLKFSNGKTQEDIVNEAVNLIRNGRKIIFIHGVCGTGKSAIALNIAKELGRASIVVPIKSLQTQYEEDYKDKKHVLKNGRKLKIEMITGRENHDSVFFGGKSCADPFLPDTIQFSEKNYDKLKEYYTSNPFIENKSLSDVRKLKRISVAPANPYWSPIVSASYELKQLKDSTKKRYLGLNGKEFIFYHRRKGCSYYDQYQSYIDADVLIFNSAKYKIENTLDRKPATDVEIIDEADEFLDNFANQEDLNLTRLAKSLQKVALDDYELVEVRDKVVNLIDLEIKNKKVLGIDEDKIFHMSETKLGEILRLLLKSFALEVEVSLDELNYANKAFEVARNFDGFFEETFVAFRKNDDNLYVSLATTDISKQFNEIIDKNKSFVFMSATLHSPEVLKHIFGIKDFEIIEAEGLHQGTIEVHKTGKEFDCKYANFSSGRYTRKQYLEALSSCLEKAKKPVLIHVNAFEDLPTEQEIYNYGLVNLIAREKLQELQNNDKTGRAISLFKNKLNDTLFTTKCSRGIDFPGDICNSVIFTKYPNPNIRDIFWKVLKEIHSNHFWEFYKDKAKRDFLQKTYRAVRFEKDHVYVLSPDSRVHDAVKEIQQMKDRPKITKYNVKI
jgi:hypothetical protein